MAKGEATIRSETEDTGWEISALIFLVSSTDTISVGVIDSFIGAGVATSLLPCAAKTRSTSVPFFPIIANTLSTAAVSPSFKPTYNRVP